MAKTNFITSDSGAVTVDWVVLTAALVGLGLATMSVVSQGVSDLSGDVDTELKRDGIIRTSFNTFNIAGYEDALAQYLLAHDSSGDYDDMLAGERQKLVDVSNETLLAGMENYENSRDDALERAEFFAGYTGTPSQLDWLEETYNLDHSETPASSITSAANDLGVDPTSREAQVWATMRYDGRYEGCYSNWADCTPAKQIQADQEWFANRNQGDLDEAERRGL